MKVIRTTVNILVGILGGTLGVCVLLLMWFANVVIVITDNIAAYFSNAKK